MEPLFSLYSRFTVGTFLNLSPRPLISLACVSSETHNLQRVFATGGGGGGVVPYIGYIRSRLLAI